MTGTAFFILLLIAGFAYMLFTTVKDGERRYCEECGRDLDHFPMGVSTGCDSCDPCRCDKGF